MKINRDKSVGIHYMNEDGIVLGTRGSGGTGDSLGRTAKASLVFDEDRDELIEAVKSYYTLVSMPSVVGDKIYVTRCPNNDLSNYLRGNSRDHVVTSMACLKQAGEHEFVKDFIKNRGKRPCINHSYILGQSVWFRALYSKPLSWVYAIGRTPWLLLTYIWNLLLRLLSGTLKAYDSVESFLEAHPSGTAFRELSSWRQKLVKLTIPSFSYMYSIHEANALASKWAGKFALLTLRPFFEKSNYLAKAMCGKKIDKSVYDSYKPTRANRWTVRLDDGVNRDMRVYDDKPESSLELAELKHAIYG